MIVIGGRSMSPQSVVKIVCALVESKRAVKQIEKKELPKDSSQALENWISSNGLPVDAADTEADFYEIRYDGNAIAYVADFTGDDPDPFRAIAIIEGGEVLGESLEVRS
jgi:hypothetical protein